jgi:N utilization substance protein A
VTSKGPVILLSRTHPNFVAELFKMEIPEIYEGLVTINDIVREAGDRTKLTVSSKNAMVDPVGACVGMKGTRVQSIVRELRGERIDIIPWTDDPRVLIAKALSPAAVESIGINEDEKSAMVVVNDQQLSIAIGKKGQNVRLAMKLTGWDIDIISETEYNKIRKGEIESQLEELQEENNMVEEDTEDNQSQAETESQEELASEDEEQNQ